MPQTSRHLAAILFADIVGYTALMGADEDRAFQAINHFKSVAQPLVAAHNGQWHKDLGDGALCSFDSALDAVKCALDIQKIINKEADYKLHVGIHSGDVTFKEGDVFGNSVNIAARIEGASPPGTIFFSKRVFDDIKNKTGFEIVPMGSYQFKNVAAPIEIFALANEGLVVPEQPLKDKGEIAPLKSPPKRRVWVLSSLLALALISGYFLMDYLGSNQNEQLIKIQSEEVIAVFPFSVSGNEEIAYLEEGMVNLLSTKLDGAGNIRAVDPNALIPAVRNKLISTLTPKESAELARQFGANLFIVGTVLQAGNQIQFNATLYATENWSKPKATADKSVNKEEEVFEVVDDLIQNILTDHFDKTPVRLNKLAALTTESYPALKAYLAGENAVNRLDFTKAVEYFDQAISSDSTFALAFYKASLNQMWCCGGGDKMRIYIKNGLQYSQKLSGRNLQLLKAYEAFSFGRMEEAEELYRKILGEYPNELEGWYMLGETLMHLGPVNGRHALEGKEAFEKAFSIYPEHILTLAHLVALAAKEDNGEWMDLLFKQWENLDPDSTSIYYSGFESTFIYHENDSLKKEMFLEKLKRASDGDIFMAVWSSWCYRDLSETERICSLYISPNRSKEVRAAGFLMIAYQQAAQGKWKAAKKSLSIAEELDYSAAITMRAYLALGPLFPVEDKEIEFLYEKLSQWNANNVPSRTANFPSLGSNKLQPLFKAYLMGMIAARLGKKEVATHISWLENNADENLAGSLFLDFALCVKAEVEMQNGNRDEALKILLKIEADVFYKELYSSPVSTLGYSRFLTAKLLAGQGQIEQAETLFKSMGEPHVYDHVFLPPAFLEFVKIYEQKGDFPKALEYYQRFLDMWKDCDPEVQHHVETVKEKMAEVELKIG